MKTPISWIAEKIEHWPIDRLVPYARNPRTHSEAQIAQIAASIAEFGFTNEACGDVEVDLDLEGALGEI